jgi:hypothetical protein
MDREGLRVVEVWRWSADLERSPVVASARG